MKTMKTTLDLAIVHTEEITKENRLESYKCATHVFVHPCHEELPTGLHKICERGNHGLGFVFDDKYYAVSKNDKTVDFLRIFKVDYSDSFEKDGTPKYGTW